MESKIKDNYLLIDLYEVFSNATTEQKKTFIHKLALQQDVITMVTNYICGEDEFGSWTSAEQEDRQKILERIEQRQIKNIAEHGPMYGWHVWSDIQKSLKDIRCKQHIYWALTHSQDDWTKENAHNFFKRNKIESDYTTEQADADIAAIKEMIRFNMEKMVK